MKLNLTGIIILLVLAVFVVFVVFVSRRGQSQKKPETGAGKPLGPRPDSVDDRDS